MPLAGFEPAIPAIYRVQTYSSDRKATGIGPKVEMFLQYYTWN